ncbi:MAG: NAD-dependent epimerase/dehydratase family protein [bacterium]
MSTPFEKKNVLVTGGAGFIGSHICERLLKENNHVICVDTFSTSSERNIDHLLRFPDFEFLRLDINEVFDPETLPELDRFKIKFQGIQEIYHLATPMSVKGFDTHVIETLHTNSIGTIRVLDLAKRYKSKFVLASSSVVYGGRQKDTPLFDENFRGILDHMSPRGCYDEGKRFAETATQTYVQAYDLDAKIARIFRTYGPRMPLNDGQMIPDFIVAALEDRELQIFGDENFMTSLMYVDDAVSGLMKLMGAAKGLGAVNFGSDQDLRLVDVASLILKTTNSKAKISFQPRLLFMTELGLPSIAKARDTLGWLPLTRLEEGLRKTIEYAKAHKFMTNGV